MADKTVKQAPGTVVDFNSLYQKLQAIDSTKSNADIQVILSKISKDQFHIIESLAIQNDGGPAKASIKGTNRYQPLATRKEIQNFAAFESRCHAFYRMIGLPIVSPSASGTTGYFSPGIEPDDALKLDTKERISNEFINSSLGTLSIEREKRFLEMLDLFQVEDISSSVAALALINPLPLTVAIDDLTDPFALKKDTQQYKKNFTDVNTQISMTDYVDEFGNKPTRLDKFYVNNKGYHLIRPMMVDPRIHFTSEFQYRVPFVSDPKNSTASKYPQPLLEVIITQRLNVKDNSSIENLGEYQAQVIEFLQSLSTDTDITTSNQTLKKIFKNSNIEDFKLIEFINCIENVILILINSIKIAQEVQNQYHWFPIVSKFGPEWGMATQPIKYNKAIMDNGSNFFTSYDLKLIQAKLEAITAEIDKYISPPEAVAQSPKPSEITTLINPLEGFVQLDLPTAETSSTSNISADKIASDRAAKTLEACKALTRIEQIIGEFSGFGIIDLLVIKYSLFLMDIQGLVGLIDNDAYNRMKESPYNLQPPENPLPVLDAIKMLESTMKDLYSLTNDIYENINDFTKLTIGNAG